MKKIFTLVAALACTLSMSAGWWLNGSMNDWRGPEMTGENGVLSVTIHLEGNKEYKFKLNDGSEWYGNNGTIEGNITDWVFSKDEKDNCTLKTTLSGKYIFTLKVDEKKLSVTYPTTEEKVEHNYYITGNGALVGDEWKVDAIKMDYNEESKLYTHTFNTLAANEYQLKITNGSWAESWGASNIDGAYAEIKGGNDNNIVITLTQATTLTVKFDAEAKKISFEGLTVIESVISYVLMGVGGDWATGIEMTQNPDNENEYQLIGQPISEGDVLKVATKNNSITVAWCNKVDEASVEHKWTNDGNIILAPGKYNFFYKVKEDLIYIQAATESAVDNVVVEKKATKIIRNGQMYILRNGVMYNSVGQMAE